MVVNLPINNQRSTIEYLFVVLLIYLQYAVIMERFVAETIALTYQL